jgi:hypothetical protein
VRYLLLLLPLPRPLLPCPKYPLAVKSEQQLFSLRMFQGHASPSHRLLLPEELLLGLNTQIGSRSGFPVLPNHTTA